MKKAKKTLLISAILLLPLVFLTGCSKVSLTGSTTGTPAEGEMGTPPDGGTPSEGGTPPADGGTPPSGGPSGAPAN